MPLTTIINHQGSLSEDQRKQLFNLWNREYPATIAYKNLEEFQRYLDDLNQVQHRFVHTNNQIVGWQFTFMREGNRWFGMIVDSRWQGQGLGTKLLKVMQSEEQEIVGWAVSRSDYLKADGTVYRSPIEFYEKNGFVSHRMDVMKTDKLEAIRISWKNDETTR